jgi:hypothetical protein
MPAVVEHRGGSIEVLLGFVRNPLFSNELPHSDIFLTARTESQYS